MKPSKTFITVIISIIVAVAVLAMQKPVTKILEANSSMLNLEITNTWELPDELKEISGIDWLYANTFACVQDEDGYIYIYDLDENKITSKIKFAEAGDYEGIAVNGENAYVMRSDGLVYEVQNFRNENIKVTEFKTDFSEVNNIESLMFDKKNNRLLTIPKDKGLTDLNFKGVYQIALDQKTMDKKPIAIVDMNDKTLKSFRDKKIQKTFNPSDIAIHPKTNELYILEGKHPKFIVLDVKDGVKNLQPLDEMAFPQPEGMTFSDDGRLFISNEGKNGTATITELNPKQSK